LRVVNSAEKPPEFKKPDFSLSHLIEMGNFMVGEQNRVENSQLVDEYNRLNRGKNSQPNPGTPMVTVVPSKSTNGNGSTQPKTSNGFHKQQVSNTHLTLETQEQVRNILSQGHKIGIEHVDERRFRMGSWQSCSIGEINGESDAISILESCLSEYAGEYIRLVAIDPKGKKRVMETIIQRPNGK
jgi:ribulose bisphosphate carboxylase small subunit